jgi:hypothetical protein
MINLFKKTSLIIAGVLLMSNSSCQKEGFSLKGETDYIIFGSSYGMCVGDCAVTYLLKSDGLYRSKDYLKTGNVSSFTEKLSDEKFQQLKNIPSSIPSELINYTKDEETFGCPDCADQGGYYLELIREGKKHKTFRIDTNTDQLQDYVKKAAEEIRKAIEVAKS